MEAGRTLVTRKYACQKARWWHLGFKGTTKANRWEPNCQRSCFGFSGRSFGRSVFGPHHRLVDTDVDLELVLPRCLILLCGWRLVKQRGSLETWPLSGSGFKKTACMHDINHTALPRKHPAGSLEFWIAVCSKAMGFQAGLCCEIVGLPTLIAWQPFARNMSKCLCFSWCGVCQPWQPCSSISN